MIYPKGLTKGDLIGVCAPSSGIYGPFIHRVDGAIKALRDAKFRVIETSSVRNNTKEVSNKASIRAKEFEELYFHKDVKLIIPPWGGQFLMEILPFLDFERIKAEKAKWVQGFSDTSLLLFALSTIADVASSHGPNLTDFGARPVHSSVWDSLKFISGVEEFEQTNLCLYQKDWGNIFEDCFIPYNLTEKVIWKSINKESILNFGGRLLGGCLDVLDNIVGSPFDKVEEYINKYKDDGILWFFESCEMHSAKIYRTLWQMKMNGWFKHCRGFIFGRPDGYSDMGDFNLEDALREALYELQVPVIYNADIGHLPPQITLVNGAVAEIDFNNGKGTILQKML